MRPYNTANGLHRTFGCDLRERPLRIIMARATTGREYGAAWHELQTNNVRIEKESALYMTVVPVHL